MRKTAERAHPADFEQMLRGAGLRVTRPRVAVLSAVHEHPHADTESIIGVVRADLGDVSHQAVYDVLRALTDRRAGAADPAVGLGGALRGPGGRQPPPRRLPVVRRHRRRRLRRRRRPVPDRVRRLRLHDRRGRGHLLGRLPRLRRRTVATDQPHEESPDRRTHVSESENPAIDAPTPEDGPAQDQPGLVAQPARPAGAAPALAPGQPAGRGLRLRRGVRDASTSRRSSATSSR